MVYSTSWKDEDPYVFRVIELATGERVEYADDAALDRSGVLRHESKSDRRFHDCWVVAGTRDDGAFLVFDGYDWGPLYWLKPSARERLLKLCRQKRLDTTVVEPPGKKN